jgi:hypothetical protein
MRHAATDTVPETLLGDATIREVLAIVTHDDPDQSPGMHAAIRGVLARRASATADPPAHTILTAIPSNAHCLLTVR